MKIYMVVSIPAPELTGEPVVHRELKYLSRTHAEEVCCLLNQRRAPGHPGYSVEEFETDETPSPR